MSRAGHRLYWRARRGGKTWQIRTLSASRTLVIDVDRGTSSFGDFPVDIVRPSGWEEIADLFCLIGGANPSLPPSSAYGQAHFEKVSGLIDIAHYDTFVLNSISQIGREVLPLCRDASRIDSAQRRQGYPPALRSTRQANDRRPAASAARGA